MLTFLMSIHLSTDSSFPNAEKGGSRILRTKGFQAFHNASKFPFWNIFFANTQLQINPAITDFKGLDEIIRYCRSPLLPIWQWYTTFVGNKTKKKVPSFLFHKSSKIEQLYFICSLLKYATTGCNFLFGRNIHSITAHIHAIQISSKNGDWIFSLKQCQL